MTFTLMGLVVLGAAPAMAQDVGESVGFFQGLQNQLVNTLAWVQSLGLWAPIVFIVLYVVITVAFLPASIVTLGAGFIFGVVQGSFLVFVAAMLGATAAFLIGRYVARDWIAAKISGNKKFAAIDDAIAKEGRKLVFLIRLSPAFPFNLLNYALGLTQVSLPDYVLGTTGILPGTIMYVYLGSLVKDLATLGTGEVPTNPIIDWTIKILIFVTVVAISVYITSIARKALQGVSDETVGSES
ncbi:TVP38/TMEM64 family protein [Leptothoe sp. PORK10 BA2]|uniref:TVP38/TMEM64 family protein n=1 Tax=Leptothoe sp. PORK10 BA2 TaxID=3110254 RepID=UPI002B1FA338|nr:TVP38/TMEM64 family protein [Leptothoe sp. PORK10 BA2]MEA5466236.1 TVP38/TMEM64 family protein [Leptothoe sp. PORK10 BA2]